MAVHKGGSWQGSAKPKLIKKPPKTRPKDSSLGGSFGKGGSTM